MQEISEVLYTILAIDLAELDFQDFFSIHAEVQNDERIVSPVARKARLYTKVLSTTIAQLSVYLVRFEYEESPFASPIIGFIALNTLESNGAWIAAHNFTFVISGMIHCMQIWLLGYHYATKAQSSPPALLQVLVREQFQRF